METAIRRTQAVLRSGRFFTFTVALFVFEAGLVALTGRFPMAYDESYHFGLIKFFSHHLNPVITSQSPDTYRFGPLVQNTSFLYHYLMSFPERLIAALTDSPLTQVICLRFINIALAVAGLFLVRKLLRILGFSQALANLTVLVLALTPMYVVLSAQINYDNLLVPAAAGCFCLTISLLKQLDKHSFDIRTGLGLLALCFFANLVKYAFLPIFAGIVIVAAWRMLARRPLRFRKAGRAVTAALAMLCILGGLLFARIYVVNLARYHNPVPPCNRVLSTQDCAHYYAWNHLYTIEQDKLAYHTGAHFNLFTYSVYWSMINFFELFSALVPLQGDLHNFLPFIMFVMMLGAGAAACTALNFGKLLRHHKDAVILAAIGAGYTAVLGFKNYQDYLRTGQTVMVHGRYLAPVLICFYALLALGAYRALAGRRQLQAGLAALTVAAFVCFGGAWQYLHFVNPVYGPLSSGNNFILYDALTGK